MASGGRAPAAPDYVGAAREQGRQNILAAQENARLNRIGTQGPYGSTSWSGNDRDGWSQVTTLNPDQQNLLSSSTKNQQLGNMLAGSSLERYGAQAGTPIDRSGYNARTTSVGSTPLQYNVNSPGVSRMNIDTSGLANIPGADDFSGDRRRVEDAYYNQSMRTLDPQFQQQEDAMRTRLLNSGVREGSEAWQKSWDDFGRTRNAAYGDARDRSIINAGQEQSRMLGDALNIRGQQFGERTTEGTFANDAAGQQLQAELARLGFFNDASNTDFDRALTNANLGNEQRTAQFGEDSTARQMSMQELMSLIGGTSGATVPQGLGSGASSQGVEPVDFMGALNNQYGANVSRYNANQASANATNQGLSTAALAALLYFSDRRLKRDIKRVGHLENGLNVYEFRYLGDDRLRRGVMSDEVREFMPEAVHVDEHGYDKVDYNMIGAAHLVEE